MNFKLTKYACFYAYPAMSAVFSLPPLLFVTFREMYGISYTLLGTLVLVNFCTQLLIDLIFSFFSKHFNIKATVKAMPLLTSAGLLIYAFVPLLFPQYAYFGLVTGTIIFSVSAGLCEVLISPIMAALPSDNSERDMSILHSLYAYGVLAVIILGTVFLKIFGTHNWMYLTMFFAVLPILSFILFSISPIPNINISEEASGKKSSEKKLGLLLFALCIFFGSAAENAMTNWISGYIENGLKISKIWGDLLGMAAFALLLGFGRTLYAKFGKHILRILLLGMGGSILCYLIAGLSSNIIISMIACTFTGFCTSMLWPGTLIMMEEKLPGMGVVAYALMAAGGDFGAAISPQLLGVITDSVSSSGWAANLGRQLSLTAEQIGLKTGMLTASVFPIAGVIVLIIIKKYFSKQNQNETHHISDD